MTDYDRAQIDRINETPPWPAPPGWRCSAISPSSASRCSRSRTPTSSSRPAAPTCDPKDAADVQRVRIAVLSWLPTLDTFTLTQDNLLARIWLDEGETWNPLARTDLEGIEPVELPESWRTPETARAAFRKTWCEREGLSMAVCDHHPPSPDRPTPATRAAARAAWCGSKGTEATACQSQLDHLNTRFEAAWAEERSTALANLPRLALVGRDLRNVAAFQTSFVDTDLRDARLEGANLGLARLEGADLSGATGGGEPQGGRFPEIKLGRRIEPGVAGPVCGFRGVEGLTQAQLDELIGNAHTLLPDTGSFTIPSCWKTPPDGFDTLVESIAEWQFTSADDVRSEFLCSRGEEPQRTGTPLDVPYPDGHPLAGR